MASLSPVYPRKKGFPKSIPPVSRICSANRLFPCLDPLALPRMATSPCRMAITGLIVRRLPARAAAFEILPPFFRYSSVSRSATSRIRPLSASSLSTTSSNDIPLSISLRAYSTSARWPRLAFSLSTTRTTLLYSSAAILALCQVPDSFEDNVMTMACAPCSFTSRYASSKA